MRRIVYAVAGTAAGLATLLTLKAHTGTSAVPTTGTPAARPSATATAGAATNGAGAVNGSGGTSGAIGTASGTGGATAAGNAPSAAGQGATSGTQEINGNAASTIYGPVQVQVTVTNRRIARVTILQQPAGTAHDLQIGQFAFPRLEAETLSAQSAKIDAVSGATYTSGGYIQSLQSAIDRGA
jgi:uncharacterized protein with FMN-binding domain